MFNKKKPNVELIRKLKIQISKKYQLPESTIISIAELACHEPGCPPIETIITSRAEDGSMQNWKIGKSIDKIEESDINQLEKHSH